MIISILYCLAMLVVVCGVLLVAEMLATKVRGR
jgi:hypothetical protein